MSLRFKRNLPIILLLVVMLSFLVFAMGNQSIAAYTVKISPSMAQAAAFAF